MYRCALFAWVVLTAVFSFADETALTWPPALPGAINGTVTFSSADLLTIPAAVKTADAAPFDVPTRAPVVDLAFHDQLGPDGATRRLWSSWGDICVASDDRVYC